MSDSMDWVDKAEAKRKEERSKEYFDIEEGANRFVLLSPCAPLAQVYEGGKYRVAVEGDEQSKIQTKGVCWVLQTDEEKDKDGTVKRVPHIKQAKLPYLVVKAIRGLQQNPDWEFKVPFPHVLTLNAEGAGTKEVKYSLTPSPKSVEIPQNILDLLAKKPTPQAVVDKMKGKTSTPAEDTRETPPDYPAEDINPDDIPF